MPAPFVEDVLLFPLYNFSFFVKNYMFIGVWINIQVFDLNPFVNLSVFMAIPSCSHHCSSVIELGVTDSDASGSSFIVQDCFGYPCWLFLVLPYELEYSIEVCEELCWDFVRIALNL